MCNSVRRVSRCAEGRDEIVHHIARSFAGRTESSRGVIQIALTHSSRFSAADNEHDFAFWVGVGVSARELRDGAPLEFLELLGQLSRDHYLSLAGSRLDQRFERRTNAVWRLEQHNGRPRIDYLGDDLPAFPSLAGKKSEECESLERQTRRDERRHDG